MSNSNESIQVEVLEAGRMEQGAPEAQNPTSSEVVIKSCETVEAPAANAPISPEAALNNNLAVNPFSNEAGFELAQRMARLICASDIAPKDYRGSTNRNIANAVIALNMAYRMGLDVFQVMQNLYIVNGRPAWSSQFMIGAFNATRRFSPIQYKFRGEYGKDDYGCQAYAYELATGELYEGPLVTLGMAKAEGWSGRNPKWRNMPDLMLRYRSAAWLVRTVAPELGMGFYTADEARDIPPERAPQARAARQAEGCARYEDYARPDGRNIETTPERKPREASRTKAAPAQEHDTAQNLSQDIEPEIAEQGANMPEPEAALSE